MQDGPVGPPAAILVDERWLRLLVGLGGPENSCNSDCLVGLARLRDPIKEINYPSLERVFGTYDDKSVSLDVFLDDVRSMPQLVGGNADVGPNGVLCEVVVVEPKFRRQQPLDRWPYAVDY